MTTLHRVVERARTMINRWTGDEDYRKPVRIARENARETDAKLERFDTEAARIERTVDRLRSLGSLLE